jgi:hypothetical protein
LPVPKSIDSSQSLDGVTFKNFEIGQEFTMIGDIDDLWEGRKGGGFLGKITMVDGVLLSLFLVPHEIWTKG